jgi:hypothetical protein
MDLPVEKLASMTPEQERQFWEQFERDLDSDTGEAAQAHLAAGHPIYYGDPAYPGHVVNVSYRARTKHTCADSLGTGDTA